MKNEVNPIVAVCIVVGIVAVGAIFFLTRGMFEGPPKAVVDQQNKQVIGQMNTSAHQPAVAPTQQPGMMMQPGAGGTPNPGAMAPPGNR